MEPPIPRSGDTSKCLPPCASSSHLPTERPSDAFGIWTRNTITERCGPQGSVTRQLGHWWVSHVYVMWEHGFRPRFAVARGVSVGEVIHPLMGDLRHIRNGVLHHRGIATDENAGRCQHLRWFSPGEDMLIIGRMVYEFMDRFGLAHPPPTPKA